MRGYVIKEFEMISNQEILRIAMEQSATDINSKATDFLQEKNAYNQHYMRDYVAGITYSCAILLLWIYGG